LDCGCGLGGTSIWLAKERDADVTGVDLLDRHVERAQREATRVQVSAKTRFVVGDFTATRLAGESFDVVLAQETLCHVERKERFYQEAHRLLAVGGTIIIAEYMRLGRIHAAHEEHMMREWCDGWIMPDLLTAQEHCEAARAAGFSSIEISDSTARVSASLERLYRKALYSFPIHRLLRSVGLRTDAQHGNITAARLQFELLKRGAWFYGLLRARK
jgi:tocopherol O-methyltransferase